jgi:crossover junction endodeoxyribonuclease RuvC
VERVFMHRNADSALKLGHARSAALCASFPHHLPIHEYAAREIKQTVTGTGAADKAQVQTMVKRLLGIQGKLQSDAGDALAVAVCHVHMRTMRKLTGTGAGAGRRR